MFVELCFFYVKNEAICLLQCDRYLCAVTCYLAMYYIYWDVLFLCARGPTVLRVTRIA